MGLNQDWKILKLRKELIVLLFDKISVQFRYCYWKNNLLKRKLQTLYQTIKTVFRIIAHTFAMIVSVQWKVQFPAKQGKFATYFIFYICWSCHRSWYARDVLYDCKSIVFESISLGAYLWYMSNATQRNPCQHLRPGQYHLSVLFKVVRNGSVRFRVAAQKLRL